jgi:hypothetical protein
MQHAKSSVYSFYYSPSYDILWFSLDFDDEPFGEETHHQQLKQYYGEQVDSITTILVEDVVWGSYMYDGHLPGNIALLGGLQTIVILDANLLLDDIDSQRLHTNINEFRAQFELLKDGKSISIWLMDRWGKLY